MVNSTELLIKKISKKPNITILFALKTGRKKWSELEKLLNKKYVHQGIKELLDLGLIQIVIIRDSPTGTKYYELTPLGKRIVELIEEMEKEFEKYHSKAPSRDPKKFINKLLVDK
ncbi:hypothetical protein Ferp_2097 [Ferroglobus placidus DSM 10642]|uniref:HTH hxlR-type domain-containing protein n=1 Tax=Ferroglobus placidus (strain DSM 10642 / AEDII12DO) TaxID=589924 RepID=D3S0G5_FERPA|nr:winged helix-turn-helix transcriptional regulator [Ferroglobus placidus]ADC66228.1 hypothetical protein Ferp_2097 [Ferroglobus placidus DSM 10642]